jgi:hypothetical protein
VVEGKPQLAKLAQRGHSVEEVNQALQRLGEELASTKLPEPPPVLAAPAIFTAPAFKLPPPAPPAAAALLAPIPMITTFPAPVWASSGGFGIAPAFQAPITLPTIPPVPAPVAIPAETFPAPAKTFISVESRFTVPLAVPEMKSVPMPMPVPMTPAVEAPRQIELPPPPPPQTVEIVEVIEEPEKKLEEPVVPEEREQKAVTAEPIEETPNLKLEEQPEELAVSKIEEQPIETAEEAPLQALEELPPFEEDREKVDVYDATIRALLAKNPFAANLRLKIVLIAPSRDTRGTWPLSDALAQKLAESQPLIQNEEDMASGIEVTSFFQRRLPKPNQRRIMHICISRLRELDFGVE